jgi:TRAP-type C4-dicarboxylate transport system permease small subunit
MHSATRIIAGTVAFLALLFVAVTTCGPVSTKSGQEASAIQITQIYTEGAFAAIVVIGLLIAVYVITRRDGPPPAEPSADEAIAALRAIQGILERSERQTAPPAAEQVQETVVPRAYARPFSNSD